jgi:hypothetical protein
LESLFSGDSDESVNGVFVVSSLIRRKGGIRLESDEADIRRVSDDNSADPRK